MKVADILARIDIMNADSPSDELRTLKTWIVSKRCRNGYFVNYYDRNKQKIKIKRATK